MVGIILLVLISISVYLFAGPLPRVAIAPFQKFKQIKWRHVRTTNRGLGNSDLLVLLWILHTDLLAGLTLQSSISRAVQSVPTHLFPLTKIGLDNKKDIVDALFDDSLEINNQIFCDLIKILKITNFTGSSTHTAVKRLIERAQNEQRNMRLVASELAGTKATVLVLACLPILGMLMSAALGINPVKWLLGNAVGWVCIFLGFSLEILGLLWVRILIARATGHDR